MIEAPELVPSHEFETTVRARLDAAMAALAAAAEAERIADEEVTTLRGDAAIGLIDRGKLLVAQRRLARAQETHETAKAALKAVERQIQRERNEREEIQRERDRADRAALAELRVEHRARAAEIFTTLLAGLDELEGLHALIPDPRSNPTTASGIRAAGQNARSAVVTYRNRTL